MRPRQPSWLAPLIAVLLLAQPVFAVLIGVRASGGLERLELIAFDRYLAWRAAGAPPETEIALVPITDADWKGWLGEQPIPDLELATVLSRLAAAGAVAIGLDLIRNRPEPGRAGGPADYDQLVRVMAEHPQVIGAWGLQDEHGVGFDPPPSLAETRDRIGLVDMVKDPDGVVRRGLLYAHRDPTLGLLLAQRYLQPHDIVPRPDGPDLRLGATTYVPLQPDQGGYATAEPGGYQFLQSYPACNHPLPTVPIGELLHGQGQIGDTLAGKIVLVGNQTTEANDVFHSPIDCHGPGPRTIFGVALHAQIASQLIRQAHGEAEPLQTLGQVLRSPPLGQLTEHAWIWLWTALGGVSVVALRSTLALAALTLLGLAILITSTVLAFVMLGWWLPVVPPAIGAVLALTLALGYALNRERQRWAIVVAQVSEKIADVLWRRRKEPTPVELVATVLFSDIRGFTTISELLPEKALMAWLNEYMAVMTELVTAHDGSIEKLAGDGITASFGVPEPSTTEDEMAADARASVDCALNMGEALVGLNRRWQARGLPEVGIRVGIHTGPLIVGNLGSATRKQYSIIGDTANTAARLESYGKDDPTLTRDADHCRILISAATLAHLGPDYRVEAVGALALKGKARTVEVYRVLGVSTRPEPSERRRQA